MTTYTVTVTKTATNTTYAVTLPNGDCGHALLLFPVMSGSGEITADDPVPSKTFDELGVGKTFDTL